MHSFKKFGLTLLASLFFMAAMTAPAVAAPPGQRTFMLFSYKNISTATTTTIKSGAGILHMMCVNTVGTTVVLFDNTAGSGTKIASWTTTALGCFQMDVAFSLGLTAVTVGSGDLTFAYQ
jgi:hypothetical protein